MCSLTLTLKLQDISKGPRTHTFPFPIIFFSLVGHEQIEQSTIQSASRVTLAPQNEKAEKLVGKGSEEASESGRPVWSAVHIVQVHIGSNLQRGRFRPCVSGLLAKRWAGGGPGQVHGISSALLPMGQVVKRGTWGAREYLVSCVNAIRGSRVAGACCRSHRQNAV